MIRKLAKAVVVVIFFLIAGLGIGIITQLQKENERLRVGTKDRETQDTTEAENEEELSEGDLIDYLRQVTPTPTDLVMIAEGYFFTPPQLTNAVQIDFRAVLMEEPGFIVLYDDVNLSNLSYLGNSIYLKAGDNRYVTVNVRKRLRVGQKVFATIKLDKGDKVLDKTGELDNSLTDAVGNQIIKEIVIK